MKTLATLSFCFILPHCHGIEGQSKLETSNIEIHNSITRRNVQFARQVHGLLHVFFWGGGRLGLGWWKDGFLWHFSLPMGRLWWSMVDDPLWHGDTTPISRGYNYTVISTPWFSAIYCPMLFHPHLNLVLYKAHLVPHEFRTNVRQVWATSALLHTSARTRNLDVFGEMDPKTSSLGTLR